MGPEKGPDSSGDRIYGFVGEVSIYHSPDIVFAKDVFIHSEDSHSVGRLQQGMDRFAFLRVGFDVSTLAPGDPCRAWLRLDGDPAAGLLTFDIEISASEVGRVSSIDFWESCEA